MNSFYGYLRAISAFLWSFSHDCANINIWRRSGTVKPGFSFSLYERKEYRSCRCCLIKTNKIFTVIIIYKTNLSLLMPTSSRNLLKNFLVFFIIIFFSLSKIDFCCHFSIIYGLPLAFFSSSRRSSSRLKTHHQMRFASSTQWCSWYTVTNYHDCVIFIRTNE